MGKLDDLFKSKKKPKVINLGLETFARSGFDRDQEIAIRHKNPIKFPKYFMNQSLGSMDNRIIGHQALETFIPKAHPGDIPT